MKRRAFLASLTGSTLLVAGCSTSLFSSEPHIYNPRGQASIRPIDEPYIRHGLTSGSEQYLSARLFHAGDSLPVTDNGNATEFSEVVEDLSEGQFAILTMLRTAAAIPAYLWPTDTRRSDGRLSIDLERQPMSETVTGEEAVGVALTVYEVDGEPPDGADIVFPGGAILSVGKPGQ